MKKETFKGRWFRPENQEEEISGTLFTTDEGEFHLDLVGNFSGRYDLNKKLEIILGYTSDGKELTLAENYIKDFRTSSGGFSTCVYIPNFIIIGKHYHQFSEIKLEHIDFKIKSFSNWLGIYGFDPIHIDQTKQGKIQINYDLPEKIMFDIKEGVSGEFNFFVKTSILHFTEEIKVTQSANIRITGNNSLSLDTFLDLIFQFQTFFGLAYFNYPEIETIEGVDNRITSDFKETTVKIILILKENLNVKERVEFLFRYSDIKLNIGKVFSKWFSKFEIIKPVLGGLIQSFNKENKVTEFNFLSIVQSLETLHRRLRKNIIFDKPTFKAAVSEIISSAPEKHKEWVKDRFLYANEPTLINRLRELLNELPKSLKQKLFTDEENFIIAVRDSRNYYTHYSLHLADKALKDVELFYTTERLKVILVAFLLKEIGILDEKFEKEFLIRGGRIFYHTFQSFKSYISS